jgi:hypothetical protein
MNSCIVRVSRLLAGCLVVVAPLAAQAPTRVEQIPVYPGAARQPDREAEVAQPMETSQGAAPGAQGAPVVRVYRVAAAVEDVVRFYQQRLAAREIFTEEDRQQAYAENLAAGQHSAVVFQVDSVDLGPQAWADAAEGSGRTVQQYAAAVRAAYAKARTPFRPDKWLDGAYFEWAARESEDVGTDLSVQVQDVTDVSILDPTYHNVAEVEIWVRPWRSGEAIAEEQEEARNEEAERPVAPMAAPTEAQLGVPLYPGARFDGLVSAQMSASDEEANYYVYGSGDAVATIATFYEQRTGKKGTVTEGGVMITVRGQGLFPDLAIVIQPNETMLPPSAKSVITIRKRR